MPKRKFISKLGSTYCRLCLKGSQTELAACGEHLKQAIKRYIGLDIDIGEEGFPEGVCHSCSNKVLVFHEFAELCRQKQHQIKDFLQWTEYSVWKNEYDSEDEEFKGFIRTKTGDTLMILHKIVERLQHEYCYEPVSFEYDSDISSDQSIGLSDASLNFDEGRGNDLEELCFTPDSFLELILDKPDQKRNSLEDASSSDDEIQPLSELADFLINAYGEESSKNLKIADRRSIKTSPNLELTDFRTINDFDVCTFSKCSHLIDHNYTLTSKCGCSVRIKHLKRKKTCPDENSVTECERSETSNNVLTESEEPQFDNDTTLRNKPNSNKEPYYTELDKSELFLLNKSKDRLNKDDELIISLADPHSEILAAKLCASNHIPYYPAGLDLKLSEKDSINTENNKKPNILLKQNESLINEQNLLFNNPNANPNRNKNSILTNETKHITRESDPELVFKTPTQVLDSLLSRLMNEEAESNNGDDQDYSDSSTSEGQPLVTYLEPNSLDIDIGFVAKKLSSTSLCNEINPVLSQCFENSIRQIRPSLLEMNVTTIVSEESSEVEQLLSLNTSMCFENDGSQNKLTDKMLPIDGKFIFKKHSLKSSENKCEEHETTISIAAVPSPLMRQQSSSGYFRQPNGALLSSIEKCQDQLSYSGNELSESVSKSAISELYEIPNTEHKDNSMSKKQLNETIEPGLLQNMYANSKKVDSNNICSEQTSSMTSANDGITLNAPSLHFNANVDAFTVMPDSLNNNGSASMPNHDSTSMLDGLSKHNSASNLNQNTIITGTFKESKQYSNQRKLLNFNACDNGAPQCKANDYVTKDKSDDLSVKKYFVEEESSPAQANNGSASMPNHDSTSMLDGLSKHNSASNLNQNTIITGTFKESKQYSNQRKLLNFNACDNGAPQCKANDYVTKDKSDDLSVKKYFVEEESSPAQANKFHQTKFDTKQINLGEQYYSEVLQYCSFNNVINAPREVVCSQEDKLYKYDSKASDEKHYLQLECFRYDEMDTTSASLSNSSNEVCFESSPVSVVKMDVSENVGLLLSHVEFGKESKDELQLLPNANSLELNSSVLIPNSQNNRINATVFELVGKDKIQSDLDSMNNVSSEPLPIEPKNQISVLESISNLEDPEQHYLINSVPNEQSNVSEKSNLLRQICSKSYLEANGALNINIPNESSTENLNDCDPNNTEIPQSNPEFAELLQSASSSGQSQSNEDSKVQEYSNISHRLPVPDKDIKKIKISDRNTSGIEILESTSEFTKKTTQIKEYSKGPEKLYLLGHLDVERNEGHCTSNKKNNISDQSSPIEFSNNTSNIDSLVSSSRLTKQSNDKIESISSNQSIPLQFNDLNSGGIDLPESTSNSKTQTGNIQLDSYSVVTGCDEKSTGPERFNLLEHSEAESIEAHSTSSSSDQSLPREFSDNISNFHSPASYSRVVEQGNDNIEPTHSNQSIALEFDDPNTSDFVFSEADAEETKPELNCQMKSDSVITELSELSNVSEKFVLLDRLKTEGNEPNPSIRNEKSPDAEIATVEFGDNTKLHESSSELTEQEKHTFVITLSNETSVPLSLTTQTKPNNPTYEHPEETKADEQHISELMVSTTDTLSPNSQTINPSKNAGHSPTTLVSIILNRLPFMFNIETKNQSKTESKCLSKVLEQCDSNETNGFNGCNNVGKENEQMESNTLEIMNDLEVNIVVGSNESYLDEDETFDIPQINKLNENIIDIDADTYKQIFDEQYYTEVMQYCSNSINVFSTPQKVILNEEMFTRDSARNDTNFNQNYVDLSHSRASKYLELDSIVNENLETSTSLLTNISNDEESRSFEEELVSVDRINNSDNVESLLTNIEFQSGLPLNDTSKNIISKKNPPNKELRIVLERCKIPKKTKLQRRTHWYFDFVDLNCHICGMECRDWESHELHNSMEHASQPGVTCVCGRILVSKVQVQVHARKHSKGKLKPNVNDGSMTRLRMNIKFFRCGFCVDKCRTWKTLSIHCERAHRLLPSAKCEYCPQKFGSPINFQLHIMAHEKSDPGSSSLSS